MKTFEGIDEVEVNSDSECEEEIEQVESTSRPSLRIVTRTSWLLSTTSCHELQLLFI